MASSRWRNLALLGVGLLATLKIVARIYTRPLDIGGFVRLPRPLQAIKERDGIAYPLHAILGAALNLTGGLPLAAGYQWIKAAAHARSTAELERAASGLARARNRSRLEDDFDGALCAYLGGGFHRRQARAMSMAGLRCLEGAECRCRCHRCAKPSLGDGS
jgi:hypothetical protein